MKSCSFCGKTSAQVKKLVAGPPRGSDTVYICNECLEVGYLAVRDQMPQLDIETLRPSEIYEFLDQYVIGQSNAKVSLSVAVYNHYKRIRNVDENVVVNKSNVLMVGPSGSGKTLLVSTLAKRLKVPFVQVDATVFTETGYVGADVDSIAAMLLESADGDVDAASRGIVLIDEIDKRVKRGGEATTSKDISGEGVQQALLKLVEGKVVNLEMGPRTVELDTSNVLFIAAGAFVGLEALMNVKRIGFAKPSDQPLNYDVTSEHLIKYGLIPEFVGRFPVVTVLEPLTREMMIEVMTKPKNCIVDQFRLLFDMDGIELEFSDEYIQSLADLSIKDQVGARSLRGIMERDLKMIQFNLPELKEQGIDRITVLPEGNANYHPKKRKQ